MIENVDDMILVVEVADTGSFSQAASRLQIPKSTLSQRISKLEQRLGLMLFNRSTRRVSVTGPGASYLEHCRRVRAELIAASLAMSSLKEQPAGNLRITCPEITASYFMPVFLAGFTGRFPQVTIELIATNAHLDLIRERVDFAFRVGPISHQHLSVRKLSDIRRVLVAAPEYLSAAGMPSEPTDLSQHRCLVHSAMPEWSFTSGQRRVALKPRSSVSSDSLGFLFQSCLRAGGIALLPEYVCQPAISTRRLVEMLPGWRSPPHGLRLVSARAKAQSGAQRAFRDYAAKFDFSALSAGFKA